MILSPEDKFILSAIKIYPSQAELDHLNELILLIKDWNYLIKTIIDRGIGPLLFKKLSLLSNNNLIPEYIKDKLQHVYYKTFSRSSILYEHYRKIVTVFYTQNIPVIALKGVYLSEWLYQDIGLRQFSDIDLLVREEHSEKCLAILESLGYKAVDSSVTVFVGAKSEIIHYPPMVLSGVSIELHIKLHRKAEAYHLRVAEIWKNSLHTTINGALVQVLGMNDLLIHICLHLDKHFRGAHVQFTCFNDLTNILERNACIIDWNEFIKDCQSYNCEDVVFEYIILTHKYINATVPADIVEKYSSLLTKKDEKLFCKYLHGHKGFISAVSSHFDNLNEMDSNAEKVRYVRDIVFPLKSFMISKYTIKNPSLYLFYYPYRYFIGIKGLIIHIQKRISKLK